MQAEEKLEAAQYFLGQMRESNLNGKLFIFNLDAFLDTSRSITFVLQKEFKSNPKFKCWYCEKEEEMRKDDLMRFFKDMRDVSIHEHSPQTEAVKTIGVIDTGSGFESSLSITKMNANGTKEVFETKFPKPKEKSIVVNPTVRYYYFFVKRIDSDDPTKSVYGTDNDVVNLCEQYLKKLSDLVVEAKGLLCE